MLEYLEISSHTAGNNNIHFYLEEKNILPEEYRFEHAHWKGFSPEITIEDFSLRVK